MFTPTHLAQSFRLPSDVKGKCELLVGRVDPGIQQFESSARCGQCRNPKASVTASTPASSSQNSGRFTNGGGSSEKLNGNKFSAGVHTFTHRDVTTVVEPRLAYEVFQGESVNWSPGSNVRAPPTALLLHGLLGNRRNMNTFAKMLVKAFPTWQVVLMDLPCHGESAYLPSATGARDVMGAGNEVLALLSQLKLFPNIIIGHSFGGKVVLSMVHAFGSILPRPVKVWVLDTLPGQVRPGEFRDHPGDLIATLLRLEQPIPSRKHVVEHLQQAGFSDTIAQWVTTNLTRPTKDQPGSFWTFDLAGIQSMYETYQATSLWPVVAQPPKMVDIHFVKAAASTFRWGGDDEKRLCQYGHKVHLLKGAGHWVHSDNPQGLLDIIGQHFKMQE